MAACDRSSIGLGFADPSADTRHLFALPPDCFRNRSPALGGSKGWKPCLGRGGVEQGFLSFRQGRSITGAGAALLSPGLPGAG